MNNIHIIMPFSRAHLKDELLALYQDVILHPIVFAEQNIEWDKAVVVEYSNDTNIPYYKINQFIKTQEIIDEDYYWCMCDDDSIEENVIPEIKEMDSDVIFISMKRGNSTPLNVPAVSQHPTDTLYAKPSNVKPCQIGLEQMIIKGRIFKKLKFNTKSEYADGEMAVYLKKNYPIHYEPNLFAKFNYFEPDRWVK